MEKLLVNEYTDPVLFNTDNNSVVPIPSNAGCRIGFIAQNAGQAISNTEVVDYNVGDLVMVFSAVNPTTREISNKIIVSSDVVAKQDIIDWQKSVIEKFKASTEATKKAENNETI